MSLVICLLLIQTGRDLGVQSILTGQQHPALQRAAEEHAAYQARVMRQGHQEWGQRVQRLRQAVGCRGFREVVAESWPGQTAQEAAKEMYQSWRLSPDHWSAVNGRCRYYGYAMVRGKNGVWYACGIFGD